MMIEGSYDDVFDGCEAVFHVAEEFGTDRRWLDATSVVGMRRRSMRSRAMQQLQLHPSLQ
jgi:hypothetical protein